MLHLFVSSLPFWHKENVWHPGLVLYPFYHDLRRLFTRCIVSIHQTSDTVANIILLLSECTSQWDTKLRTTMVSLPTFYAKYKGHVSRHFQILTRRLENNRFCLR